MSFITFLVTGLSIAASPGHANADGGVHLLRVQTAQVSGDRGLPATDPTPRDPTKTDGATRKGAPADPDRQAKAQKHYDPSHEEATENRTGRSRRAQGKRNAAARQRATKKDAKAGAAASGDVSAPAADPNRPK